MTVCWIFLPIIPKRFGTKTTVHIAKQHHTRGEVRLWQHQARQLFFFSWNWAWMMEWIWNCQNKGQFWHKTLGRLLASWRWRGISNLSQTSTQKQSIQINKRMAPPKEDYIFERPSRGSGPMNPIEKSVSETLEVWQIQSTFTKRISKYYQVEMCHADRLETD